MVLFCLIAFKRWLHCFTVNLVLLKFNCLMFSEALKMSLGGTNLIFVTFSPQILQIFHQKRQLKCATAGHTLYLKDPYILEYFQYYIHV